MPEQDYDRLEQFFRRAAAKADVTFNEDDWKKLEARLDAGEGGPGAGRKAGMRGATATVIALVVSLSVSVWVASDRQSPLASEEVATVESRVGVPLLAEPAPNSTGGISAPLVNDPAGAAKETEGSRQALPQQRDLAGTRVSVDESERVVRQKSNGSVVEQVSTNITDSPLQLSEGAHPDVAQNTVVEQNAVETLERNKQKAVVELPGAEEEETREAQAMVQEEHASDNKKHVATPRLSLLLSFAPDFSGTSMALGSSPGKAFGGMIHYHPFRRWSVSAGVIKNYKVYTGDGEDYKPPKNYWKYYTNGVIPETIDGSCSIVEFPVMIQYTAIETATGRMNVALGGSSYLMESESYRYNFAQPNPGARDRWDSRRSSHFVFNMLNFTIGYERQIMPGFMLGIEPYVKIPLEEIGWSNLKLFSSGASFTLRYTILRRNKMSVTTRARGPD